MDITEIEETLSQKEIYERFQFNEVFNNISSKTSHRNNEATLITFLTTTIHDKSGTVEITTCGKVAGL